MKKNISVCMFICMGLSSINVYAHYTQADLQLVAGIRSSTAPIVENALRNGANPNIFMPQAGFTALNHAIVTKAHAYHLIKAMVARGADVNLRDGNDNTPLLSVMQYDGAEARKADIAKLLLEAGADPFVTNKQGQSFEKFVQNSARTFAILKSLLSATMNSETQKELRQNIARNKRDELRYSLHVLPKSSKKPQPAISSLQKLPMEIISHIALLAYPKEK